MALRIDSVVVTCEHAGNRVPPPWRHLFLSPRARAALASHRGLDIGALPLARTLARTIDAPIIATVISRLLVETNRSLGHPSLFSEFTRRLSHDERRRLLALHYLPHRAAVEAAIVARMHPGARVLHLAVHSFTPILKGEARRADIGLLYDPARPREARLCNNWLELLKDLGPILVTRRNYPYRGASDGLTTSLRKLFGAAYMGIELEVNQKHLHPDSPTRKTVHNTLAESLRLLATGE